MDSTLTHRRQNMSKVQDRSKKMLKVNIIEPKLILKNLLYIFYAYNTKKGSKKHFFKAKIVRVSNKQTPVSCVMCTVYVLHIPALLY